MHRQVHVRKAMWKNWEKGRREKSNGQFDDSHKYEKKESGGCVWKLQIMGGEDNLVFNGVGIPKTNET